MVDRKASFKNHTYSLLFEVKRIRNGVIKPREPIENDTKGGTGPLNMFAACNIQVWTSNFKTTA